MVAAAGSQLYKDYIDQLAKKLAPFKGKEVPEKLVERFTTLDGDGQKAVRDRLRSLLNGEAKDSIAPQPEPLVKTRLEPRPNTKISLLLAILQKPGGHFMEDMVRGLNSTPSSVAAMLSHLRKQGHSIIKSPRTGAHGLYTFSLAPSITLEGAPVGPLSRQERGGLGAKVARRRSRRHPGKFFEEALRILENAGEAGLSIDQWAAALNCTTGGLYRQITTMRRNGNDIGMKRIGKRGYYIWRGKPDTQSSLFNGRQEPRILSRNEVAELFSVAPATVTGWARRERLPPSQAYIRNGIIVFGWEESVIEQFVDRYPVGGFHGGGRKRQHGDAAPDTSEVIDNEPVVNIPQPHIETEMVAELPPEPEPAAPQSIPFEAWRQGMRRTAELMEASQRDAADRHEELLAAVQSLRADHQTDRMPAVAALRALDLHLHPGFDVASIIEALSDGSDPRSVRDWLSKLQGKIKRLAQKAAERV